MNTYALEIVTVPGSADPAFLDRLAAAAYAVPDLRNLHMGLNDDASVTAIFDLDADGPLAAAALGVQLFSAVIAAAKPLEHGRDSAVERFGVSSVTGRDLAPA